MEKCKCIVSKLAFVLVIVGALNWGLVGVGMFMGVAGGYNLVSMIFGSMPMVQAVVYVLVGVAAVVKLIGCKCAKCKACMAESAK